MMPTAPTSFVDIMLARAAEAPAAVAYRFHRFGTDATEDVTYGGLADHARSFGAALQARGLQGARIVLALPHGPDFILAFYGCLAGGVIAVPVPMQRTGKEDPRFAAVLGDATPALVLVDPAAEAFVRDLVATRTAAGHPPAEVATVAAITGDPAAWRRPALTANDIAVLQYTSGSTGDPKGVMISHGNMVANTELIRQTLRVRSNSRGVLWLPFYHDMGLVGAVLLPMYVGGLVDLMSPQDFLRAPIAWLEKLSELKATTTAAPNFALELCCELATPETIASLDLSALECLLTGSEPVNPNTVERFTRTFAPAGFRADAYLPAYGLAEATLLVTGTLRDGVGPTIRSYDARALTTRRVEPPLDGQPVQRLVGNGAPETRVRIADPESGQPLPPGAIGEIWITGESMARGYFNRPQLSAEVFGARLAGEADAGPFYRTGDLGFIAEDDLFIVGRIKDLIIIRGRNIYPQDVEETATRDQELLWTGGAAAFAVDHGQGEELVLVVEAGRAGLGALRDSATAETLAADILAKIVAVHEVSPSEICIVRPGRIPRTSSGKIRRGAARSEWLESGFAAAAMYRWRRPAAGKAAPVLALPRETLTRRDVETWLLDRLAHLSGRPRHMIALDEPFASYGLDSLTAIELIKAINDLGIAGRHVDPTDLYDHPTIEKLLDHMFAEAADPAPVAAAAKPLVEPAAAPVAEDDTAVELEREAAALRALLDG